MYRPSTEANTAFTIIYSGMPGYPVVRVNVLLPVTIDVPPFKPG